MSRDESAPRRNGSADRVDSLDSETLRQVVLYLAARLEHRACAPTCERAWERFYRACDPLFRKLAGRRHCDYCNVDDRIQDLWRVVIVQLPLYEAGRERFPSWLGTGLRHALGDQDRAGHVIAQLDNGMERVIPSREGDPQAACERADVRMIVQTAVHELRSGVPETTYQIIWARWIEGKSFQEIADVVGLPSELVRDRHQRALGRLRAILVRRLAPATVVGRGPAGRGGG